MQLQTNVRKPQTSGLWFHEREWQHADETATVQVFCDLLSHPGSQEHAAALQEATSEDWASVGDYSGATKSREAFLGQMGGFAH